MAYILPGIVAKAPAAPAGVQRAFIAADYSTTDGTSHMFTGHSIGAYVNANTKVLIAAQDYSAAGASNITDVQMNGVSMTQIRVSNFDTSGHDGSFAWYIADHPNSGSTANIEVFHGASTRAGWAIASYKLDGATAWTLNDADAASASATSIAAALDMTEGDSLFAMISDRDPDRRANFGSRTAASTATGVSIAGTRTTFTAGVDADSNGSMDGATSGERIGIDTISLTPTPAPDPATVTTVSPDVGPIAGGTSVVITGTGFTDATGVTFGGDAATSVVVDSATQISCVTPAHSAGNVNVVVLSPHGNGTKVNGFTYSSASAPSFTSITPDHGTSLGGTAVSIVGDDFTLVSAVKFNGVAATSLVIVDDEHITCVTPAGTYGLADILFESSAGDYTEEDGYEYIVRNRVTQAPLLVVNLPNQGIRITQAPLLVLNLPVQGLRITQNPLMALYEPKPIPLPKPIVPEVPVNETWKYLTSINISENSKEQRASLISNPFQHLSFNALILDDEDRREVYQMLIKYLKQSFYYPNYVYSTKITVASSSGTDQLYFDPAATDMRVGDVIALFDPHLEVTKLYTIDTVEADGVVLTSDLEEDVPTNWLVCPATEFRTDPITGLNMNAIDGGFAIKLQSMKPRAVERPDMNPTLTTLDSMLILDKVPLANSAVNEQFEQDITWLDVDTNAPEVRTNWKTPFVSGTRSYLIHRPEGMDYWRGFAANVKGRRNKFLLPTFRHDMPLASTPALSATTIVTSNVQYFDFWRYNTWQYLRLEREDGSVIYRKVNEVTVNYDANGDPLSLNIKLSSSIGGSAGNNLFSKISYTNIVRLNSDEIDLQHDAVDTIITISVRAVNE